MNDCNEITTQGWQTAAGCIRTSEGGAPARNSSHHQYGRRIEADSSWSVYHVFTGIPAEIGGCSMTGLSRSEATGTMMALNRHNERRRQQRSGADRGFEPSGDRRGQVMTLGFPNPSRSFDAARNAVRFIGHDGMFEVRFLVEADALEKSDEPLRRTGAWETKCLAAFDASRVSIHDVARKAYARARRRNSYTLTAADFR